MDPLRLRPWSADDIGLLQAANTPAMTTHLNGPESDQEVIDRHAKYRRLWREGTARTFVIVDDQGRALGSIAHWGAEWREQPVREAGWFVLPEAQGRGVSSRAIELLIEDVREHRGDARYLTAYPSVDNAASNGVCRHGGFELMGTKTDGFRGADLTFNEWVLDLESLPQSP
ncbi:GNAT family N-acetyltransferase [Microbacterium sp. KUDC0406]|uniref:GNAT family N-acetyltransferase n=1 Tax=Microbacterium sp. KUDC0406 TaxID=2909588 RepID=UPI001F1C72C9|nr:GNAT family N-acetyltransferase [Microbacterium sp. KUDC0406]UJP10507.1 GNAT family N-acetyltransferase [Microbacterium sp. KUDC0406]